MIQQEELERVRKEEGLSEDSPQDADGGGGGSRGIDPAVRAEIERRAAAAGDGAKQVLVP